MPLVVTILRPLAGTIAGTVLTPLGAPAPDTAVEICHEGRSCDFPVALTAGPDGTFELPDVPLGRFTVTARSQVTHEAGVELQRSAAQDAGVQQSVGDHQRDGRARKQRRSPPAGRAPGRTA